jgi:hypothetical protein
MNSANMDFAQSLHNNDDSTEKAKFFEISNWLIFKTLPKIRMI